MNNTYNWNQDKYLRKIAGSIESAELVSFDIFDTVLFRTVTDPEMIFYHTGARIESLYPEYDIPVKVFAGMRAQADDMARKRAWKTKQYEDVTLEEIYSEFGLGKRFASHAMECELEVESRHIYLNKPMEDFMRYCRELGKRLAIVSDTYFSKDQIISFLEGCGFDISLIDFYLISCQHRALKYNGLLFRRLLDEASEFAPGQVLHIGDNKIADIDGASIAGIRGEHYGTIMYPALHPMSIEQYEFGTVEPVLSLRKQACSLVPDEYGKKDEITLYESGASVFGPVYAAFAEWIVNRCIKDNTGTVLAFMREGELLSEMINRAAQNRGVNVTAKPIFISRRTTEIVGIGIIDDEVIDEYINRGLLNISNLFSIFYLDVSKTPFSNDASYTIEQYKDSGKFDALAAYFKQPATLAEINNKVSEQKALLIEYVRSLTNGEAAVTVDVGFRGTMQACLTAIKANGGSKLLHLIMMGMPDNNKFLVNGVPLRGWLGYGNDNSRRTEQVYRRVQVLEAVTNADIGTTLAYERNNGKIVPILENISISDDDIHRRDIIRDGIRRYQDCWFELIKNKECIREQVITDRNGHLGILSRLLLMPTQSEALTLGALNYDESILTNEETTIIRATDFEQYKQCESEKQFINKCIARQYRHHVYWPEGVVAALNPHYFIGEHINHTSNHVYRRVLEFLSSTDFRNKRIAIYGAGKAGREFASVLCAFGIDAQFMVDANPDLQGRCFLGLKIITPEESVGKADVYIITPLLFEDEIKEKLNRLTYRLKDKPKAVTFR